jgi:transposase-like protein
VKNEIEPRTGRELARVDDDAGLAALDEGLVSAARAQGVQLTGPGGLLTGLTRQVLETALQVEIDEHLGYELGDPSGNGSGNSRNGTTRKTVRTDIGDVGIEIPP